MKKRTGVHLSYAAKLSNVWGPPLAQSQSLAEQGSSWDSRTVIGIPGVDDESSDDDSNDEDDDEGEDPPQLGQETACCTPTGCQEMLTLQLCVQSGGLSRGLCATCDEVSCPNLACSGAEGSCIEPHSTPGCSHVYCCDQICRYNPYCCDVAWDETCANTPCFEMPAKADCCLPDGTCVPMMPVPCPGRRKPCEGDVDGDGIDEACACGSVY